MSVQAITWALSIRAGSPSAKCVLLALANYANDRGQCWPSQKRLADETDQSVDSVQRRLRELEARGIITRFDRARRYGRRAVTVYGLCMPGSLASNPSDEWDAQQSSETSMIRTTPQPAAPQSAASIGTTPQSCQNDTANVRCPDEPSKEPSIEASADAPAREPAKSLITAEAFELADVLIRLQRLDPNDPRSVGVPYTVQGWLTKGWRADLIQQAVEVVMARVWARGGKAPKSLNFFKEAIAEAHAERSRPLPVSNRFASGSANGPPNGSRVKNAIDVARELADEHRRPRVSH
jgi:hypothetical protein